MVLRPRTKSRIAQKAKRCPKCGVLIGRNGTLTRCKRCAKSFK